MFQRGDGRWTARITLPNGKLKSWVRKTEKGTRAELKRALLELEKGVTPADGRITVAAFLGRWLEGVEASVRPRTYESYALNVRRLTPLIGKLKLTALSPADVQRAYAELLTGGPDRRPLSKRSLQQVGTVLHTALEAAVRWSMIGPTVTDAVSPPHPERRQMTTLSADQLDALFRATAGDRSHALWVLLGTTGMRVGEALGSDRDSVDFTARTPKVQRALQRQRDKGLVLVEPKSASSRRTVYLAAVGVEALRVHKTLQMLDTTPALHQDAADYMDGLFTKRAAG